MHSAKDDSRKKSVKLRYGVLGADWATALVFAVCFLVATPVLAEPPQIPPLAWQKRSDWIDVKTDVRSSSSWIAGGHSMISNGRPTPESR